MTKNLKAELKKVINGFGIVRCEEKKVDYDDWDNLCGHLNVWYDVCAENGEGDIIESFKTLRKAEKFAKEFEW